MNSATYSRHASCSSTMAFSTGEKSTVIVYKGYVWLEIRCRFARFAQRFGRFLGEDGCAMAVQLWRAQCLFAYVMRILC